MKIGSFEVLQNLGSGAGSSILKIRRAEDNGIYALKVVKVATKEDAKYLWQLDNEFAIASSLDHKNLVKAYTLDKQYRYLFWQAGGRLLLEFIEGRPLSEWRDLPLPRAIKIFVQTADGLACMHREGYFHADIKPENIMVTPTNHVKVIDFGLAWRRDENRQRVQGTLEFLAPEQARDRVVNARTDVYNLGATMYRVLTNRAVPALWREGMKQDSVAPLREFNPAIPRELDELVRTCVAYNPEQRPRGMREVRDRLREIRTSVRGDETPVI